MKGLETRLPRSTQIGPVKGMWGKSQVLGRKTYIAARFHNDVAAADAAISGGAGYPQIGAPPQQFAPQQYASQQYPSDPYPPQQYASQMPQAPAAAQPAGWFPDPSIAGQQRYWDGTTWTDHTAPG